LWWLIRIISNNTSSSRAPKENSEEIQLTNLSDGSTTQNIVSIDTLQSLELVSTVQRFEPAIILLLSFCVCYFDFMGLVISGIALFLKKKNMIHSISWWFFYGSYSYVIIKYEFLPFCWVILNDTNQILIKFQISFNFHHKKLEKWEPLWLLCFILIIYSSTVEIDDDISLLVVKLNTEQHVSCNMDLIGRLLSLIASKIIQNQ